MKEKTREQLRKIELEIYREMFKRAEPSANFDKMFKGHPSSEWYNQYFLDGLIQRQIIDKICLKHKLSINERSMIGRRMRTGFTPSPNKVKYNPYAFGRSGKS